MECDAPHDTGLCTVHQMPNGTYELELHCHNCGDARHYTIEKGVRVPSIECENCGIKQLKRVAWIDRKKDEDDDDLLE